MIKELHFDFKLSSLESPKWPRDDLEYLSEMLYDESGKYRKMIDNENRIIIIFDWNTNSSVAFYQLNQALIIEKFLDVIDHPYQHFIDIGKYDAYCAPVLIPKGHYKELPGRYHHRLGEGLREPSKAVYENHLVDLVKIQRPFIRIPINRFEQGIDLYFKLDTDKIVR